MALVLLFASAAPAPTFPSDADLFFQTSGRSRPATIGDWYTTATSASTDRVHRFPIDVTAEDLAAGGGSITLTVNDAESTVGAGPIDEVTGTGDPTRFQLLAADGTTVLATQTFATGTANGATASFTITQPGTFILTSVTGAFPISGDANTDLNDDDNSFAITTPSGAFIVGQLQGTFQRGSQATTAFRFLVGPGTASLALRNFDLDGGATVSYTRPGGGVVAGSASGNGIWNGASGTLDTGQDTVATTGTLLATGGDAGLWTLTLTNWTGGNQVALEVNADGSRIPLLDGSPTRAGNFTIAASGTLTAVIGAAVDHPFTVANLFRTSDIVNFTLVGSSPFYTTQLLTSLGVPLTDTDGDGNVDTGVLAAAPASGATRSFILRVTPLTGATVPLATRIDAVSFMDRKVDSANNTTRSITKTTVLAPSIQGTVFVDADHDGVQGTGEGASALTLFVKLISAAAPGGTALAAATVDPATGNYRFPSVVSGTYRIILDTNATLVDVAPGLPVGWVGTVPATLSRNVVASVGPLVEQDFGIFNGSRYEGVVFQDTGAGGGAANDGVRQANEPGLAGATVRITNDLGTTTFDTALTEATGLFTLFVPDSASGTLRIVELNPGRYVSTGGQPGNTAGIYDRTLDRVSLTDLTGVTRTGIAFGDVPDSRLDTDGALAALPGVAVVFPHTFTAGTAGTVTFSLSTTAAPQGALGGAPTLYRDVNANGKLDAGDAPVTAGVGVSAGQTLALLVKVASAPGAPFGATIRTAISASLVYANANPALSTSYSRTDVLTVGEGRDAGLLLVKTADRVSARPGEVIAYTIEYRNVADAPVGSLVVNDATPPFTVFVDAGITLPLPAALTGATITAQPAVNGAGPLRWTFGGSLAAGAAGTVTFRVRVQ